MRIKAILGVAFGLSAAPCLAGYLEDGIRLHERAAYKNAASALRKAAEMGDAPSQFEASIVYYKGQGVERDRAEAAKWWTLVMSAGGRYAEIIRPMVRSAEAKLAPEEIAEGKRRAAAWLKDHPARQ